MSYRDRPIVSKDGRYPISLEQGVTWSRRFVLRDDEGDRIDLTGRTGIAQMRDRPGGTLLLTFDVDLTPLEGEVLVTADGDDIESVTKSGVWDCRLTGAGLEEIRVVALSPVTLIRQVSQ